MPQTAQRNEQTLQCTGAFQRDSFNFQGYTVPELSTVFIIQGVADMLASQGVKKAQADRALTSLAEEGKIQVKEFGKIKIYFPPQDGMPVLAPEVRPF